MTFDEEEAAGERAMIADVNGLAEKILLRLLDPTVDDHCLQETVKAAFECAAMVIAYRDHVETACRYDDVQAGTPAHRLQLLLGGGDYDER